MLILTLLFAIPIIISIVCKKYKVTIFSAVCAIPAAANLCLNLLGYSFTPHTDHIIVIASFIVCIFCIIASVPTTKWITILLCTIITIPVLTFLSLVRDYSVEVTIDETEYSASYCGFNVGPTVVSYHEKYNSVFYKYEPSFYSGLICMGGVEDIGEQIKLGEVTEFCATTDDVYVELEK